MPKLYRVQDKDGLGPYSYYTQCKQLPPFNPFPAKHRPAADKDFLPETYIDLVLNKKLKFGFPTFQDFIDWFGDEWAHLQSLGFSVIEIEAKRVYKSLSGKQCLYEE